MLWYPKAHNYSRRYICNRAAIILIKRKTLLDVNILIHRYRSMQAMPTQQVISIDIQKK